MPFEIKKTIQAIKAPGYLPGFPEYLCEITDELDKFNVYLDKENDPEYRELMRSYIMRPESESNIWHILIRNPGATRGCIYVVPYDGKWAVTKVELYPDTAINTTSKIGCYKPEVLDILESFVGYCIDFGELNPNGGK